LIADAKNTNAQPADFGDDDARENDVQQTVILASIVEKETAAAEERPLVASVYRNRMAEHEALQADPSVIYAELLQGSYSGALHHADMQFSFRLQHLHASGTAARTHRKPWKTSLQAALHPAEPITFIL